MSDLVLITGGAGFIGSHLADELLASGYRVRALDSLVPQVHGAGAERPSYLNSEVELIKGDVRDPVAVKKALEGVEAVFHLAALVGVGQSMYEVRDYTSVNNSGTAVLLESIIQGTRVEKIVTASSMSIYGEGLYADRRGNLVDGGLRDPERLKAGVWDLTDADGVPLIPLPTPESKSPNLASVYALSKYDQERMSIILGNAYDIPVVALRLFNVYGPRQALSNPYTGVLAIFASSLLNENRPRIFEDGFQRRDFVNVVDVAVAFRLALESEVDGAVFNIGSGESHTLRQIVELFGPLLGRDEIKPDISGMSRAGDIRHCFADIAAARRELGYQPRYSFREGLASLAEWVRSQMAVDNAARAHAELAIRGLTL